MIAWLFVMAYFVYEIWVDVKYMTELMHAYVKMVVENIRH